MLLLPHGQPRRLEIIHRHMLGHSPMSRVPARRLDLVLPPLRLPRLPERYIHCSWKYRYTQLVYPNTHELEVSPGECL